MTREEIRKQNMEDMGYLISMLNDILRDKELSEEEENRLAYGTKVLKNIINKEKEIR